LRAAAEAAAAVNRSHRFREEMAEAGVRARFLLDQQRFPVGVMT
jgi:hypothetical protein